jgi:hypothetical protein
MSRRFSAFIGPISPDMHARMNGRSWHDRPGCPRPAELALLRLDHWDFRGQVRQGQLVVARTVAREVVFVFERIFNARFPIAQMVPIHVFGGDDNASMEANNSSAFNFRTIAGTDQLSQHGFGLAIDINPVQNPWVRKKKVSPPAGRAFLERDPALPGVITRPGPVTEAFDEVGWRWGGDWPDIKDYHHFQKHPR